MVFQHTATLNVAAIEGLRPLDPEDVPRPKRARHIGGVNPSGSYGLRDARRSRLTTTVSTSISSCSMNAAKPLGPKASGSAIAPAG